MEKSKGQLNGEQHVNFVEGDNWSGINKREYFAGLAMQGLLANPDFTGYEEKRKVEFALKYSDMLLEELSK